MNSAAFQNAVFKPAASAGAKTVPVVSSSLTFAEVLAGWKVRWGFGRSSFRVEPGLYACGSPAAGSPVLATANYRLTFDSLRKELGGVDAWILVLDTKGVNVWCAAGKGTFGTAELVRRVQAVKLASVVSHRVLVLPQLGATGVAAHEVLKASGFRVMYGPVRAADIPAFLAAGMRKTDEMRRVPFSLRDRLAVAPVELTHAGPFFAAALALAALLSLRSGAFSAAAFAGNALLFISPLLAGTLVFPALLPALPFKAFALKGAVLGLAWTSGVSVLLGLGAADAAAFILIGTSAVSFLAMNFTGSSTYTNLTGAKLEVSFGLPAMAIAAFAGIAVVAARFVSALL
jgi:hypothetical protein